MVSVGERSVRSGVRAVVAAAGETTVRVCGRGSSARR